MTNNTCYYVVANIVVEITSLLVNCSYYWRLQFVN